MNAAKLSTIVNEVQVATGIATTIIEESGIGGHFNEELVARGEAAAFGIVKAAVSGYANATGKPVTPEMFEALLITEAPLAPDAPVVDVSPDGIRLPRPSRTGAEGSGEDGSAEPTPAELAAAPDIVVPTKDEVIAAGYTPEAADAIIAKQEALKVAQDEARKDGHGSAQ